MPSIPFNLEGKVALVTAGTKGIGGAITEHLAQQGARLIVTYRSNQSDAEEFSTHIQQAYGSECLVRSLEIRNSADVTSTFKDVQNRFGRLDILVNNAGVTDDQ